VSDVSISIEGTVGRIRLNRPKALHALDRAMCVTMAEALLAWRADPAVELVLLDHAEGRGFCAGGDVRAVAGAIAAGEADRARGFFFDEYRLDHLLFTYAKPIVAIMDGVVMGGGVGLAAPARFRVATERTLLAMPEATIGLFPDVGGGWYLSRLPGRIGQYLALTAARLDAGECLALGLATHHVRSEAIAALTQRLLERPRSAEAILAEAAAPAPPAPSLDRRAEIDRLFASDRLEDVVAACAGTEFAPVLAVKSPLSMKVALRLLAQARTFSDFAQEMRAEYGVVGHVIQRPDFAEGVRALLVDKDNTPRWDPATAEEVTDHMIDRIFAPLDEAEAWTPYRL
jgi:enoyl-CoA hydratase